MRCSTPRVELARLGCPVGRRLISSSNISIPGAQRESAMAELDLVVRNGTVVTAVDTVSCDIGVPRRPNRCARRRTRQGRGRNRCNRKVGAPGRHRQSLSYRSVVEHGREDRGRFQQWHGFGGLWGQYHDHSLRCAATGPVVARRRRGLPRAGNTQGGHRLRLSSNHFGSKRAGPETRSCRP